MASGPELWPGVFSWWAMASPSPSERTAISKLRARARAGDPLSADDMDRLRAYDADRERESQARGASQTATRKVSYTEEETAAASVGTGSAAEVAAGAAIAITATGERLDSILSIGISALQRACDQYAKMTEQLLTRTAHFEETQVKLLEAMRDHFVGRAEVEAELVRERADHRAALRAAEGEGGDTLDKLAAQLLPMIVGAAPSVAAAPAAPPNGKKPRR